LGATAAAAGLLNVWWVLAATIVGNIAGDTVWYLLGYHGKMTWLLRHGRWMGIQPRHLARLEREMHAHATKLIIFAKVAYGLIVPTIVAAGMARVPFRKWFPVVFVVETLWSCLLVWVGYHATGMIQDVERALVAVGLTALLVGGGFLLLRLARRSFEQQTLALDPLREGEEPADMVTIAAPSLSGAQDAAPEVVMREELPTNGDGAGDPRAGTHLRRPGDKPEGEEREALYCVVGEAQPGGFR
jgi:membrane protein DedA with SNARE-associated domain